MRADQSLKRIKRERTQRDSRHRAIVMGREIGVLMAIRVLEPERAQALEEAKERGDKEAMVLEKKRLLDWFRGRARAGAHE